MDGNDHPDRSDDAQQRTDELLEGVSRANRILELGASVSPLTPRAEGWDVTVIDHATKEELIAKYRVDPNVDVTRIEDVDFVWRTVPCTPPFRPSGSVHSMC